MAYVKKKYHVSNSCNFNNSDEGLVSGYTIVQKISYKLGKYGNSKHFIHI